MIPRKYPAKVPARAVASGVAGSMANAAVKFITRFLAFALALAFAGAAPAAGEPVAEVSLAIGVSHVINGAGQASAVARGISVHVGDRIETGEGGHVHLRFVDGAFVSVRPGSRLVIETYRYDAARPQDSAIRFKLEQGVARSISGKAAEAARERFRLNTPIAAIGVRGTDFVVLADPERVRVAINNGAIALTPLGEGCLADALGSCSTAATRTLSADMGTVMLEFQRQQAAPRLVPINGTPSPDRVSPPVPEEPRRSARSTNTVSETNTEVLAAQAVSAAQGRALVPPPPREVPPATIVWGRWFSEPWAGDTLSVPYAEAIAGRKVTAGNPYFALFRPEPPLPVLVSNLGSVEFTLRDAQVHLLRGGLAELGRVDSGWLSVNFAARQFGTGIAMSHPSVGGASLQASGGIRDDGVFAVRTPDGRAVAGALTVDGKEAGYFFEQPVTGGTFIGTTRWWR